MPIRIERETDGITAVDHPTIEMSGPMSADDARQAVALFKRRIASADFFSRMKAIEAALERHRGATNAQYGSRAYYAAKILDTLAAVRAHIRRAQELGMSSALTQEASNARARVNAALAGAARIGYLAAESEAKGWPVVGVGRREVQKKQRAGRASGRKRREKRIPLLTAVAEARIQRPEWSRRKIAGKVLSTHGGRGLDRDARIKNLAERIRKAERKK